MTVSNQSFGYYGMVRVVEDSNDLGSSICIRIGIGKTPFPFSGNGTLGPWSPSSPVTVNGTGFFITWVYLK